MLFRSWARFILLRLLLPAGPQDEPSSSEILRSAWLVGECPQLGSRCFRRRNERPNPSTSSPVFPSGSNNFDSFSVYGRYGGRMPHHCPHSPFALPPVTLRTVLSRVWPPRGPSYLLRCLDGFQRVSAYMSMHPGATYCLPCLSPVSLSVLIAFEELCSGVVRPCPRSCSPLSSPIYRHGHLSLTHNYLCCQAGPRVATVS